MAWLAVAAPHGDGEDPQAEPFGFPPPDRAGEGWVQATSSQARVTILSCGNGAAPSPS